jgi:hypothetical protein
MARETRQYLRDFNLLNTATTTARELYDRMLEIYPDRVNPGLALERSKHRQEAAKRHTATLTSGGSSRAAALLPAASSANVCEDFMTSTNTYDPKGRL